MVEGALNKKLRQLCGLMLWEGKGRARSVKALGTDLKSIFKGSPLSPNMKILGRGALKIPVQSPQLNRVGMKHRG